MNGYIYIHGSNTTSQHFGSESKMGFYTRHKIRCKYKKCCRFLILFIDFSIEFFEQKRILVLNGLLDTKAYIPVFFFAFLKEYYVRGGKGEINQDL